MGRKDLSRWPVFLLLTLLTVVAFGGAVGNGFVDYDDDEYVTNNPMISQGLTLQGIRWAFTSTSYAANWHPLTWLSHMLDVELFGLSPGPHHLVSLALHVVAILFLFTLLRELTGSTGRAAVVAALFAVHPLRVESVVWASERKDVLSLFLGMLTLYAWVRYLRFPSVARYLAVVLCLAAGLMAKPMLVTIPLLLILLDVWPLGRWRQVPLGRLIAEKAPLLCLSAMSVWLTLKAQSAHWQVGPTREVSLATGLAAVPVSVCQYLLATVWPRGLAIFYPFPPGGYALSLVVSSAAVVIGLTLAVLLLFRRRPCLAVGWGWFLVALVPVIGIVRVGSQAFADRYTYLPHVGLLMAVIWGGDTLMEGRPAVRKAAVTLAGMLIIILVLLSRNQTAFWKDSVSLFDHAVSVTRDNALARLNLGQALERVGRRQEAVEHLEEVLRLEPKNHTAYFNLGVTFWNMGQQTRAEAAYREALRLKPDFAEARYNLGTILQRMYRNDEAATQLTEAIRLRPGYAEAYVNLGVIFMNQGKYERARELFQRALFLDPGSSTAKTNLASLPPGRTRSPF